MVVLQALPCTKNHHWDMTKHSIFMRIGVVDLGQENF
jgi:hypothetical protein